MKAKRKSLLLVVCVIILIPCFWGCTEKEQLDMYVGKKCIICGSNATTVMTGTKAMCKALNDNYDSNNYTEGTTSMTCTVFFCDLCFGEIDQSTRDYSNLGR